MSKLILKSIAYYPISESGKPESHKVLGLIDTSTSYKKLVIPAQNKQLYRLVDESTGEVIKSQKLVRDHSDLKVYVGELVAVELKDFFSFQNAHTNNIEQEPLYMVDAADTSCVRGLIGASDGMQLPQLYVLWEPGMTVSSCLNPSAMGLSPLPGLGGISGLTFHGLLGMTGAIASLAIKNQQDSQPPIDSFTQLSGKIVAGPVIAQSQAGNNLSGLKVAAFNDKGINIGSADVAADGSYALQITVKNYRGALLLKVYDISTDELTAQYRDEATGTSKDFSTLLAVVNCNNLVSTTALIVNITPLTNLAALKAGATDTGDTPTVPSTIQIDSANQQIAQKFLGTNELLSASAVATINPDGTSNMVNANGYGAALNVLSQMEKATGNSSSQVALNLIALMNAPEDNKYTLNKLNLASADALQSGANSQSVSNIVKSLGNQLATGSVSINASNLKGLVDLNTSPPQEGDKLTLIVNNFSDANNTGSNFKNPSQYQWQASKNGFTWTDITGATSNSLTLSQAQVGQQIRVLVKNTDDALFTEYLSSTATASVKNINQPTTGSLTIDGTLAQNSTLTLINTLSDTDGLGILKFQWQSSPDGSNWTDIDSAKDVAFMPTQAEVGKYLRVYANYTDKQGTFEQFYSAKTANTISNVNDLPVGSVNIKGAGNTTPVFEQNATLYASNDLTDVDNNGQEISAFNYQWQNSTDGIHWKDIATAPTYTLSQADVGKFVRVVVNYTDAFNTRESIPSKISELIADVNDLPTGSISFSGDVREKSTITANVSLSDADNNGIAINGMTYQWESSTSRDGPWQAISTANTTTFTPTNKEVGSYLRLTVRYTDLSHNSEVFSSMPTVTAVVNVNDIPKGGVYVKGVNNANPVFTQNAMLFASNNLTDADNNGQPITDLTYQWQKSLNGSDWVNISNAIASSYTLQQSDVGQLVHVRATYRDLMGATETVDSNPSSAVANVDDLPQGVLKVCGSGSDINTAPIYKQQSTLYAQHNLTDSDNNGVSISGMSYQWQISPNNTDNWTDIANAQGSSFTLTQLQVGKYIRVKVSYTDNGGYLNTVTSDTSNIPVVADVMEAPNLTLTPANQTFTESLGAGTQADPVGGIFNNVQINDAEKNPIQSISFTVSGLKDGENEQLQINGISVPLTVTQPGAQLTAGIGLSVSLNDDNSVATVVLTRAATWNYGDARSLIQSLAYQNTKTDNPTPGERNIALIQLVDNGSINTPGDNNTTNFSVANKNAISAVMTVIALNDPPVLTVTANSKTFTEGNGSSQGNDVNGLFSPATLTDAENNNISELTLTVSNVLDGDKEWLLIDGQPIQLGMSVVKTVLSNSAYELSYSQTWDNIYKQTTIVLSKTAGMSLTDAQTLLDNLGYRNTNINNPTAGTRVLAFKLITDTGSDTTPNVNTSSFLNLSVNLNVQAINDTPNLLAVNKVVAYNEPDNSLSGATPVSVFGTDSLNLTDAENNDIISFSLQVTGVLDRTEVLNIDGSDISLTAGISGITTFNALNYSVTSSGQVVTVTLTKASNYVALETVKKILEAMTYNNTSANNPSTGQRVVSVATLQDNGGDADTYQSSGNSVAQSTITVTASNDLPVNTIASAQLAVGINSFAYVTGLSVADLDSSASAITVSLTVAHGILDLITTAPGVTLKGNSSNSVVITGTESAIRTLLNTANAVKYSPDNNYGGADSLTLVSNDGGKTGSTNGTDVTSVMNIYVNRPPVLVTPSSNIASTYEDTAIEITFDMLVNNTSASDVEDGTVRAFVVKSLNSGTLYIGSELLKAVPWDASNNAVVDSSHTLYWKAAANANGPSLNAFTVTAIDSNGTESVNSVQITLNVPAVNDGPYFTNAPSATPVLASLNADYTLPTGYSLADVDAADSVIKLSFTLKEGGNSSGVLTPNFGSSGVTLLSFSGATYTFQGTLTQLNNWLSSTAYLTYTPSAGFTGNATLAMTVDDQGNTGNGSALTATAANALTITVKDISAPVLQSITTTNDGSKILLNYNEPLSSVKAVAANFTYSLNGSGSYVPNTVSINGSTVELNLTANKPVFGNTIAVNYNAPSVDNSTANAAIQDNTGNDALGFTGSIATNKVNIPPTLTTSPVTNAVPASAFTVNGSNNKVTAVNVSGNSVELTLDASVVTTQPITLTYVSTDTNKAIQDATGNDASNISTAITVPAGGNYTATDTVIPVLISAVLNSDRSKVVLTYSENLNTIALDKSRFTVTAGADATTFTTQTIQSAQVLANNPNTIELQLDAGVSNTLPFVTVAYTNLTSITNGNVTTTFGNAIQDPSANKAISLSRTLVPTANFDNVAPVLRSAAVSSVNGMNRLILNYSELLNTLANFTEGSGNNTQSGAVSVFSAANVNVGSGESQTITGLSFTVSGLKDGANETVSVIGKSISLGQNSSGATAVGSVNNMAYTVTVVDSIATVSFNKPEGITAAIAQTLINGIQYQNTNTDNPTPGVRVFDISSITDSGDADTATTIFAPGTNSSSVLVTAVNDPPTMLNSTTTLALNTTNSQATNNAINIPINGLVVKDQDAGSSLEKLVVTMTETTTNPLTYATLMFNFPVGASSMYVTKTSDNTYSVYGTVADLNNWAQLSNAISYSPKVGFTGTAVFNLVRVEDAFGAYVSRGSSVANITVAADTLAPQPISAVLSTEANNKIILNFNEPLNTTNLPPASAFTVSGTSVASINEVGSSVILTTNDPVNTGMSISYTDTPGASTAIQDAAGQHASTLTLSPVIDTIAPVLTNSMVYYNGSGSALNKFVLNFNEHMSSVPISPSQFFVYITDPIYPDRTGNSAIANIASGGTSSYGPTTVTFGINNSFLSPSASVSVTYTDPSTANDTNAIQDLAGNDVPNMVLGAWTNDNLSASGFASGKNVLVVGGQGNDSMTGGAANDTFIWFAGDAGTTTPGAVDVIKNFTPWNSATSSGDKIDISKLLTNNYDANSSALSQWVTLATNQTSPSGAKSSTKIVIDVDGSGPGQVLQTIWVEGVNLSSTDPSVLKTNFVLIA